MSTESKNKAYLKWNFRLWLTSAPVRRLSKEQRADYFDLLCWIACEEGKGIPDNDKEVARLLNTSIEDVLVIKQRLVLNEGTLNSRNIDKTLVVDEDAEVARILGTTVENVHILKKRFAVKPKAKQSETPALTEDQVKAIIEKKKADFIASMDKFKSIYTKDMLNEFYRYWTEPTQDKRKLKWETMDTWDVSRRLNTWFNNDKKRNNNTKR